MQNDAKRKIWFDCEGNVQITIELTKKICERAESGEIRKLDAMADEILKDCKRTSIDILRQIICCMNEGFRLD